MNKVAFELLDPEGDVVDSCHAPDAYEAAYVFAEQRQANNDDALIIDVYINSMAPCYITVNGHKFVVREEAGE